MALTGSFRQNRVMDDLSSQPASSPSSPDAPSLAIRLLLGLDLFLTLFPPLQWWASGTIADAPRALIYLLGTSAVIAASAVAIFVLDRAPKQAVAR